MASKTYQVLREHEGDRKYQAGDSRDLDEADAAHLLKLGVLGDAGAGSKSQPGKSEPAPKNKAEGAAPANKAKA